MQQIFLLILFVSFALPTNSSFYLNLPGIQLKYAEIGFLLLPIINYLQFKINGRKIIFTQTNLLIIVCLLILIFNEFFLKKILYNQNFSESFKSIRLGLSLFSGLIIIVHGLQFNRERVWNTLLFAIIVSFLLSIISTLINLPIFDSMDGEDVLEGSNGRLINANASFGIIGFYLLLTKEKYWFNSSYWHRFGLTISVLILVFTFNRTFIALLVISYFYLIFKNFNLKSIVKLIFYPVLSVLIVSFVYFQNETIKNQIDRRILSIIFQEETIVDATIADNRDFIYDSIIDKFKRADWIIGLPMDTPIFVRPPIYGKPSQDMTVTDISIVNILLRYGIFVSIFIGAIYLKLYRLNLTLLYKFTFIIFLLSSWNIDSLLRLNSAFFICLLFAFTIGKRKLV